MNKMKQITLFTAALLTFAGMQAQNSIDQVLRNIEANNKELQANARLISSQKLEAKTDNNLADPTLSYAHLWGSKDKSETIGELVVSQSFDFPSLYASRAKLNRLKTNSFDGQQAFSPEHPVASQRGLSGYYYASPTTANIAGTAA